VVHLSTTLLSSLLLFSSMAAGQGSATNTIETRRETVVVTGTYEPLDINEIDRSIRSISIRNWELISNTFADFLRLDPSLDLRQRAPNSIQGDLSIRGSTFGQTLILVDGQRVNDVQSGHHNLDIPLPLEAVDRVEILKGSGSTLYGSDAVGGVVNFISRRPENSQVRLRSAFGNFGVNQQRGVMSYVNSRLSQTLSFSRDFSSGFRANRDYRNLSLTSQTELSSRLGNSSVMLAYNDRPFGADQFYGNYNSWENTKTWLASLRQSLGPKTTASFLFRRHSDLFVLYRDRPQVFANHHSGESYLGTIRRQDDIGSAVKIHYGAEGLAETISSTNLGNHGRARGAVYGAVDVRALRRFSFTAGFREELYGTMSSQFSPSVSGGVWLNQHVKVRAAVSRAFRIPTYTDLYYHDPANLGSPDLRPESAWSYEGGVDWNSGGRIRGDVVVFQRLETDGIDYIRRSPADIWRATNIHSLRFTGVESTVRIRAARSQEFDFSYTGLRGAQDALPGIQSKYVFNYPVHSGIASWFAVLPRNFQVRTRFGAMERLSRDPYAVWDIYAAYAGERLRPFLQFANLTSTRYQEIPGVDMPGRSVVGGLELVLYRSR
jgi:iron complex outermembrane receptor protein